MKKSFLLLGPRSTGKTTLLSKTFPTATYFDLLDAETYATLLKRPKILEESTTGKDSELIIIDEIQKLPSLLDEVQRILNRNSTKFLLTGSSARKLKRSGVNLLAGRVWQAELFPLVYNEIPNFNLLRYINTGGLPHIYGSGFPNEELRAYSSTYIKEEIRVESLTRNIPAFASFLDLIALSNGEELNYESFGNDCGVSPITLKNYIKILEDTLIGFSLPGFVKTKKRKAISRAKHYLFDIGVTNQLSNRGEILPRSELFGKAFEHFMILEVRAWNSYKRYFHQLTYWRSTSKFEVDLIIGTELAIEIKSSEVVQDKHLKSLRALKEEGLIKEFAVVSNDVNERTTSDGIKIYPWKIFLEKLWNNRLIRS